MSLKVLYIGGTGEVSPGCITAGLELGQDITVFNRGTTSHTLPAGVKHIAGDLNDDSKFLSLGKQNWDVVCQFRTFDPRQCERDISAFAGRCGHFVFISTAMVYQRPPVPFRITESAPLGNPYSDYARKKIAIEQRLMELHHAGKMRITNVRPSHTFHTNFPSAFNDDLHMIWRLQNGKPIISHGDGTSLWTITRSEDFGRAFARLLANPKAMGETFHITSDQPAHWDAIYSECAQQLGTTAKVVHVPSDTLVKYHPTWIGALTGDKSASCVFDNSKVKAAAGGWECRHDWKQCIALSLPFISQRMKNYNVDEKMDGLVDRIIDEQGKLGMEL